MEVQVSLHRLPIFVSEFEAENIKLELWVYLEEHKCQFLVARA